MNPIWVEGIYVLAGIIVFFRTLYQARASKKENRSITPTLYWILLIISSVLTIIYGLFIGSWAMPLISFAGIPFAIYNIIIEQRRLGSWISKK